MELNEKPVLDWDLIKLVWLFLSRVFSEAEENFDRGSLGFKQVVLLAILEKPHSPLDLRRMLGGPASTMSNMLNDLEKRGLVSRTIHETDKRSFVIRRTEEGSRVLSGAIVSVEGVLSRIGSNLPEEQVQALGAAKIVLEQMLRVEHDSRA